MYLARRQCLEAEQGVPHPIPQPVGSVGEGPVATRSKCSGAPSRKTKEVLCAALEMKG